MNEAGREKPGGDDRKQITLWLPAELLDSLREFCRDKRVGPELVVERALVEYFREGDMSH